MRILEFCLGLVPTKTVGGGCVWLSLRTEGRSDYDSATMAEDGRGE